MPLSDYFSFGLLRVVFLTAGFVALSVGAGTVSFGLIEVGIIMAGVCFLALCFYIFARRLARSGFLESIVDCVVGVF